MSKKELVIGVICMFAVGCVGGVGYILYDVQQQVNESVKTISQLEGQLRSVNEKSDEEDSGEENSDGYSEYRESEYTDPSVYDHDEDTDPYTNTAIDGTHNIDDRDQYDPASQDTIIQDSLYYFGNYGGEPIAWRVLQDSGDKALLVTEYCIASKPYYYYEFDIDFVKFDDEQEYDKYLIEHPIPEVTWEISELRGFCNNDFFYTSFTEAERQRIIPTSLETNDDSSTVDNIFILSGEEWDMYCDDPDIRIGYPTAYAVSQGIFVNNGMFNESSMGKCSYWVRGASDHGPDNYADWMDVHGEWRYSNLVNDTSMGVRPAMWIKK